MIDPSWQEKVNRAFRRFFWTGVALGAAGGWFVAKLPEWMS